MGGSLVLYFKIAKVVQSVLEPTNPYLSPLVKGVGTKRLGKGRVKYFSLSKLENIWKLCFNNFKGNNTNKF